MKARKNSGSEGFMAMFGYKDPNNFLWYNVGGWTNTRNNVEQSIDGNRVTLCRGESFNVEPDRWYDLQVDVEGDSIRCFLDGELNLSVKAMKGSAMEGVYASTTLDEDAGMMYVKVVNVGDGYADGVVNLANCSFDSARQDALQLIRLSAENGSEENTLENPTHINPVNGKVRADSSSGIVFEVPTYSVNIIRIPVN